MKSQQAAHRRLPAVFAAPALLGVLTFAGLTSALLGDGLWDAVSWLLLGAPIAAAGWCVGRALPAVGAGNARQR